jgi:hypothetical protein
MQAMKATLKDDGRGQNDHKKENPIEGKLHQKIKSISSWMSSKHVAV